MLIVFLSLVFCLPIWGYYNKLAIGQPSSDWRINLFVKPFIHFISFVSSISAIIVSSNLSYIIFLGGTPYLHANLIGYTIHFSVLLTFHLLPVVLVSTVSSEVLHFLGVGHTRSDFLTFAAGGTLLLFPTISFQICGVFATDKDKRELFYSIPFAIVAYITYVLIMTFINSKVKVTLISVDENNRLINLDIKCCGYFENVKVKNINSFNSINHWTKKENEFQVQMKNVLPDKLKLTVEYTIGLFKITLKKDFSITIPSSKDLLPYELSSY